MKGQPHPEIAAMERRWGPPAFWRGRRLKLVGSPTDAAAVRAWREFEERWNGRRE